jgi:hypothetical protein
LLQRHRVSEVEIAAAVAASDKETMALELGWRASTAITAFSSRLTTGLPGRAGAELAALDIESVGPPVPGDLPATRARC